MYFLLAFLALIVGVNLLPQWVDWLAPRWVATSRKILVFTSGGFVLVLFLNLAGYSLKGAYTHTVVYVAFIVSCFLFFALVKNSIKKIIAAALLSLALLLCTFMLMFDRTLYRTEVNDQLAIHVSQGGFMACGEQIRFSESALGILDKDITVDNNLCLTGIYKIETASISDVKAEFLIFHDGTRDSETPYFYTLENRGYW
jgi:ABC-2 type transport system permease protein